MVLAAPLRPVAARRSERTSRTLAYLHADSGTGFTSFVDERQH